MSWFKRPPTPAGPYTEWFWPDPPTVDGSTGFTSFEHSLIAEIDPGPDATYFWAHQFRLTGGEGGYLGLQTKGNRADGSLGKMAIFSLWDAVDGEGTVVPFSGEGTGWSARIPYLWTAGTAYRLRVVRDDTTAEGTWWSASVVDGDTAEVSHIGRLRAPPGWGGLGPWSVMWTEYYGPPLRRCSDLAPVSAVFSAPTADDAVAPARARSHIGDGTCSTTRITDIDDGVRQEMGSAVP